MSLGKISGVLNPALLFIPNCSRDFRKIKDLEAPLGDLAVHLNYALQLYRYGFSLNQLVACLDPVIVAFSPNGLLLAVGSTNGKVLLWIWMDNPSLTPRPFSLNPNRVTNYPATRFE